MLPEGIGKYLCWARLVDVCHRSIKLRYGLILSDISDFTHLFKRKIFQICELERNRVPLVAMGSTDSVVVTNSAMRSIDGAHRPNTQHTYTLWPSTHTPLQDGTGLMIHLFMMVSGFSYHKEIQNYNN